MFETVIGLEVHVQLSTKSKLFCSCDTKYTEIDNVNICEVCTGQLGSLPVLNKEAIELALRVGIALNCKINNISRFDRKNYFYPDLPKGYQISQYYHPYAEHGYIDLDSGKRVNITRIHIEEDAGKLIHNELANETYVDMNRCSMPLVEIVTAPDISNSEEAQEFLIKLRDIIKYSKASDVSMELGSLRCDANISVKLAESKELGTRTEVKNLNSFKAIGKAIDFESNRQINCIQDNEEIVCETRLWDESRMVTKSMRAKNSEDQYRYFPDPDLLPVILDDSYIEGIRKSLPELPKQKIERFVSYYGIPLYDAKVLCSSPELADYFEEVVSFSENPKSSSNWIMTEVLRNGNSFQVSSENLGKMIKMIDNGTISGKIAKDIFSIMIEEKLPPENIVKDRNLNQISDDSLIEKYVDQVLLENSESIYDFKNGKDRALGFLVGQVMKISKGKANPQLVNNIILSKIKDL
jgi:aspartyl-tRNA(Asn)/glutamyl-tRNA(Gln) amidotransferase subunit B